MNYKILPIEEGPEEVKKWLQENPNQALEKVFQLENQTYLLVASEEKSTGGYEFELVDLKEHEQEIIVKLKFICPANDQVVIQMITRPYILIKFEKTEKKITVQIVEELC